MGLVPILIIFSLILNEILETSLANAFFYTSPSGQLLVKIVLCDSNSLGKTYCL